MGSWGDVQPWFGDACRSSWDCLRGQWPLGPHLSPDCLRKTVSRPGREEASAGSRFLPSTLLLNGTAGGLAPQRHLPRMWARLSCVGPALPCSLASYWSPPGQSKLPQFQSPHGQAVLGCLVPSGLRPRSLGMLRPGQQ